MAQILSILDEQDIAPSVKFQLNEPTALGHFSKEDFVLIYEHFRFLSQEVLKSKAILGTLEIEQKCKFPKAEIDRSGSFISTPEVLKTEFSTSLCRPSE